MSAPSSELVPGARAVLRAPAKLNLGLYVGERRSDGLHELRSLFCPLQLSDRIVVTIGPEDDEGAGDEVVCPGVGEENLVARALAVLRAEGWRGPRLEVEIDKRIPIAAGLGGGSADAAALLRWAVLGAGPGAPPEEPELAARIEALALRLGADVPSQLEPRFGLVAGAGELFTPLPAPAGFGCVLIPFRKGLSTAAVYARFDELGLGRAQAELEGEGERLAIAAAAGASPLAYAELLRNDLERAAVDLKPEIADAVAALRAHGAAHAFVTGSGPTAVGLFEDMVRADAAASSLPYGYAAAIVTGSEPLR